LIRFWGRQKANIENDYIEENERLERQGNDYLKEIERAKFHEERGKIKCECGWCEQERIIHEEVEVKIGKETKEAGKLHDQQVNTDEKEECPQCGRLRVLDEESGLCKKCSEDYDI